MARKPIRLKLIAQKEVAVKNPAMRPARRLCKSSSAEQDHTQNRQCPKRTDHILRVKHLIPNKLKPKSDEIH